MKAKLHWLFLSAMMVPLAGQSQELKDGYVEFYPEGVELPSAIRSWKKGKALSPDDNFFISRVKPRERFRNSATQVRKNLTPENDKRLICWLPVGNGYNSFRSMQNGIFDSEAFTMWSYVTHWGDWNCPIGRIPAMFLDAAHKNGVSVSSEYGIPFGALGDSQAKFLKDLSKNDPKKSAEFLRYYGQDGLGFNSEYGEYRYPGTTKKVRDYLVKLYRESHKFNSIFENIWYDGTNDTGNCTFDRGLGNHNKLNFGKKGEEASSLFFNYNWNSSNLLQNSVAKAKELGRDPLFLYAGFNMQGGEPRGGVRWPLLAQYPISIGLWGAHSHNMFWESRNEKGSEADVQQRTYMLRTERWFTGGSRNPATCPEVTNDMNYSADNVKFHGMSSFMTARSALSWDLAQEPFITFFNTGNGKFININGEHKSNNEWYSMGVQDYLPTWRFWFSEQLMGQTVPTNSLDAELVWDDAYMGGSCLRIFGSTKNEYLQLFKTKYALKTGDEITIRYKLRKGSAQANLVLTFEGNETQAVNENALNIVDKNLMSDDATWQTATFKATKEMEGKDLALMALHFTDATQMDLLLGEVSIIRETAVTPAQPKITSSELFCFNDKGVDGKIIFDMPNNKKAGEPCYNIDVNTALFKVYSQQENGEIHLVGVTSSWASMVFSAPMALDNPSTKIRLGVSAVSLDFKNESEIAWSKYMTTPQYDFSDDIECNKLVIKPNEKFNIGYTDLRHEPAKFTLTYKGTEVFTAEGVTVEVNGVEHIGSYDLKVEGIFFNKTSKKRETMTKTFSNFLSITPESVGALPEIYSLTANGQEENISVESKEKINFAYTARNANGQLSQGLSLSEKGFAFNANKAGMKNFNSPFTISFWLKYNSFPSQSIQLFDVRNPNISWPVNNWGSYWSTVSPDGKTLQFVIRNTPGGGPEHKQDWEVNFTPGLWAHVSIVMESNGVGIRTHVYIDGKEAKPTMWAHGNMKGVGLNPRFQECTTDWDGQLVLLGFGRHGTAAMDATIDNLKFFPRALSAKEIEKIVYDDTILKGQTGYFSFDTDADEKGWFNSEVENSTLKGSLVGTTSGSGEGQLYVNPFPAIYDAGCPFVTGAKYKVETTANWSGAKAIFSEETNDATSGKATAIYHNKGDYEITLTLTNSYGKAQRTFKTIKVTTNSGIENVDTENLKTYNIGHSIFVEFDQADNYLIEVYNAAGQPIKRSLKNVDNGEKMRIDIANSGVYVLRISKEGKTLRAVKLLCK